MLKMMGNEIWREGKQVGRVEGSRVYAKGDDKLGYFDNDDVFNMDGQKLAYVRGNYLYSVGDDDAKISLDKVRENIEGGIVPMIAKCAIYVLLGA